MSMYKDFVTECTTYSVVETDKYFFTYRVHSDTFFIRHLYIKPEYRNTGLPFRIIKQIRDMATEASALQIAGQFYPENPFCKVWDRFCLAKGFESCTQQDGGMLRYIELSRF